MVCDIEGAFSSNVEAHHVTLLFVDRNHHLYMIMWVREKHKCNGLAVMITYPSIILPIDLYITTTTAGQQLFIFR